jgi:uncharacterized protein YbaP (TraB family)
MHRCKLRKQGSSLELIIELAMIEGAVESLIQFVRDDEVLDTSMKVLDPLSQVHGRKMQDILTQLGIKPSKWSLDQPPFKKYFEDMTQFKASLNMLLTMLSLQRQ